jgi:hypothetical protein
MPADTIAPPVTDSEDSTLEFDEIAEIDSLLGLGDIAGELPPGKASESTAPAVADNESPDDDDDEEEKSDPAADPKEEEEEDKSAAEEGDDEDQSEPEEEEEEKSTGLPASVQKRINKLTARAKGAEEELSAIRAERDELKSRIDRTEVVRLTPTEDDPLADVSSTSELEERLASARRMKAWALENWDGTDVPSKDGESVYYDAAKVRGIFRQADSLIEVAPKRSEFLQQQELATSEARRAYPDMFKSGSEFAVTVENAAKAIPGLLRLPNWRLIIGDALVGAAIRNRDADPASKSKKKAATDPSAPKLAPRQPGAAERRSTPTSPSEREAVAARERESKPTETREQLEDWLESIV